MSIEPPKVLSKNGSFFASNGFTLNEIQAILNFKPLFPKDLNRFLMTSISNAEVKYAFNLHPSSFQ